MRVCWYVRVGYAEGAAIQKEFQMATCAIQIDAHQAALGKLLPIRQLIATMLDFTVVGIAPGLGISAQRRDEMEFELFQINTIGAYAKHLENIKREGKTNK